jgi:hypothetical protein
VAQFYLIAKDKVQLAPFHFFRTVIGNRCEMPADRTDVKFPVFQMRFQAKTILVEKKVLIEPQIAATLKKLIWQMTVFVVELALLNVPKFGLLVEHEHRIVKIVSLPSRIYVQIPSNLRPLRIRLFNKLETLLNALFQLRQVNGVVLHYTPN